MKKISIIMIILLFMIACAEDESPPAETTFSEVGVWDDASSKWDNVVFGD